MHFASGGLLRALKSFNAQLAVYYPLLILYIEDYYFFILHIILYYITLHCYDVLLLLCYYDYFGCPGRSHRKAHIAWAFAMFMHVCFWESGTMGCFGLETGVLTAGMRFGVKAQIRPVKDAVRAKGEGCVRVIVCVCGWIYSAKLNIVLINLGTGACVLKATPFHLGYVWRRRLEIRPRLLSADMITLVSANPSHCPNTKPYSQQV